MKRALFAVLLLALSLPAAAQGYVFGGTGFGTTLGAGYRFTAYLAAELSAFDAREETDTSRQSSPVSTIRFRTSSSRISGAGLSVVGSMPVSSTFSVFAKAGAYRVRNKTSTETFLVDAVGGNPSTLESSVRTDVSSWEPGIGLGVEFAPDGGRLRVRLSAEQIGSGGKLERSRIIAIGVSYSF